MTHGQTGKIPFSQGSPSYEVHLHKTTFAHASIINFIQCCFLLQQLSFFFPANVLEYLNGTAIPADHTITAADDDAITGVSGIIPEQQYQQMLKKKHFGENSSSSVSRIQPRSISFLVLKTNDLRYSHAGSHSVSDSSRNLKLCL